MWKKRKFHLLRYREKGEGQNVKSFFARRRKWRKFSKKLFDLFGYDAFEINGIFLDLDSKGYKRKADKVTLAQQSNVFSLRCSKLMSSSSEFYFWSSRCNFVRIRSKMPRLLPKKKAHGKAKSSFKCFLKRPSKRERALKRRKDKSAKINNASKPSKVEQYFEDSHDFIEEGIEEPEFKWAPRPKRIRKSLRYLCSDGSIEKRHSKHKSYHLKTLMEDFAPTANRKQIFHSDYDTEEEMDSFEFKTSRKSSTDFVLGDFFKLDHIKCDFKDSSSEQVPLIHKNPCNSDDGKTDIEESDGQKQADSNATPPMVATIEHLPSDQDHFNIDKPLEKKEILQSNPLMVFLSRFTTRPDNLRKDFKLNYKEAVCKPRRFIIDISQLAYQSFVLNCKSPIQAIPKLDLTVYLVFTFLKEDRDDLDQYRVELNSTLLLNNSDTMLASICQEQTTSVHEIMQKVVALLASLETSQIPRRKQINLKDNTNEKALHSFNLLTSACKWNTQIIDYPDSLEWTEGPNSIAHLTLLLDQDFNHHLNEDFQPGMLPADSVLAKKMKMHQAVRQGPHKPLLCGKCLQDFTTSKCFYPLALCICSHWFCEMCWKSNFQLQAGKLNNDTQFKCLEDGCSSMVDPITMLSFMPVQFVRDYQFTRWRNGIEKTPQLKLCPNPSCQRIIFAKKSRQSQDDDQNIIVTCSCFYQTCFSCMSQPHWPLSCAVAQIYHRRMAALDHNNFHRRLEDKEFPDMVLKGKSCPKCGAIIQANFQYSGWKDCLCGCVMCWPCGKEVNELQHDLHESCSQRFQIEDSKLKQRLNNQTVKWNQNDQMTRWYKLALTHRQHRHPEVATILYNMAYRVAEAVSGISRKGKYVGNAKQAALGWKSHFRKLANIKFKLLVSSGVRSSKDESNNHIKMDFSSAKKSPASVCAPEIMDEIDIMPMNSFRSSSRLSVSSGESLQVGMLNQSNSVQSPNLQCDPILKKAISNIVDTKLELHHVIEHVSILLEYSHALHQPGKIIRCLERAEDLCTYLDMLLQPTHTDGSTRIIPSFLRLRTQVVNMLTNLQCCLRENKVYHNTKVSKT